mgnify:CR=1 FL=1
MHISNIYFAHLYLIINENKLRESIALNRLNVKNTFEYELSEIVIQSVKKNELQAKIKEVINKIKVEGFKKVAMDLSISETSLQGGNLGWVSENAISEKFKSKIINTPVGNISEPIILPEGILFFKVRDKRKLKKFVNLEDAKKTLEKLNNENIITEIYSNVTGNPTGTNVNEGVIHYKKKNCDGVIAFGGGSGLDVGKAVAFMSGQTLPIWDFEDVGDNWTKANSDKIAPITIKNFIQSNAARPSIPSIKFSEFTIKTKTKIVTQLPTKYGIS